MPRRPIARGIAVMIVHSRGGLWVGPRRPAGGGLGARHGEASQQSGNQVAPQPPRVVLEQRAGASRTVGPCYQGARPMT